MTKTHPFNSADKQTLLKAAGTFRNAMGNPSLINDTEAYRICNELKAKIDELAGYLTGDKEYFWGKSISNTRMMDGKE